MHRAVLLAAALTSVASLIALRYLPHTIRHRAAAPAAEPGEELASAT
jgi:hypothetical protein